MTVAGETAIAPAIVRRAAQWMARLWAEDASDQDAAACAAWRAAHPDHERAWQRLQQFDRQFEAIPRAAARQSLHNGLPRNHGSRRRALQALAIIMSGGGAAMLAKESDLWQRAGADYRTAVGETRTLAMSDGTQVVLDTASAVDARYSDSERRLVLRAGAMLVTSAPGNRPLLVQTAAGLVRAIGTCFAVRDNGGVSRVDVFEGAVQLLPSHALDGGMLLRARRRASFTRQAVHAASEVADSAAAWTQGKLVAERLRLADLLAELGRYRHGVLHCDEAVAGLRVTGVFSLHDTDRALRSLAASLPVRLVYRTRYWVTLQPS